jgi:hypothetical protein
MELEFSHTLISDILKDFEEAGTLDHLVQILIINESADKFLTSILENGNKLELITTINTQLNELSKVWAPLLCRLIT